MIINIHSCSSLGWTLLFFEILRICLNVLPALYSYVTFFLFQRTMLTWRLLFVELQIDPSEAEGKFKPTK